MTRKYELMTVFRSDVDVTEKNAKELIQKLVGDGVTVVDVTFMGKRTLAYPIQKKTEGIYVLSNLTGNIIVHDIEKRVQLGAEVLRFLLTVKK